jgi:hypothetical protein
MNILVGNAKPGKPAIHGSVLGALPYAKQLAWLVAIIAGEATLLSVNLTQLPRAFGVHPTDLREARRAAGQIIKSQQHMPAKPTPVPPPVSTSNVDVVEALRKIGSDGFLKLAAMAERDEIARAIAAAKANGALNGGAPAHTR